MPVLQFNNSRYTIPQTLMFNDQCFFVHLNVTADILRAILISVLLLFNHTVVVHISFVTEKKKI